MILALQITLIITSVLVVLLVLLHRAKGGGLSTLFGGGVQSSLSGSTVVEKNLDRLTPVSYTHLTLPTIAAECRSRWSPYN